MQITKIFGNKKQNAKKFTYLLRLSKIIFFISILVSLKNISSLSLEL